MFVSSMSFFFRFFFYLWLCLDSPLYGNCDRFIFCIYSLENLPFRLIDVVANTTCESTLEWEESDVIWQTFPLLEQPPLIFRTVFLCFSSSCLSFIVSICEKRLSRRWFAFFGTFWNQFSLIANSRQVTRFHFVPFFFFLKIDRIL